MVAREAENVQPPMKGHRSLQRRESRPAVTGPGRRGRGLEGESGSHTLGGRQVTLDSFELFQRCTEGGGEDGGFPEKTPGIFSVPKRTMRINEFST